MFSKNIKFIQFLLNMLFIFLIEGFIYFFHQDYVYLVDRLTTKLASINILYVKIFQAFAFNNNLINDEINNKLLKFTDNAPWTYSDINFKELFAIADENDLVLNYGYEVPINSGMISLVFKAYKKHERHMPIIIKMKRKNIKQKLENAIDNLAILMYCLSFIPIIHKYQLRELVNKNIKIIEQQTNFIEEIDNMDKIRENCKYLKYVKIPKANKEVTLKHPDFILMEYINGLKIDQIKQEDYDPFAKLVIKFGLVTTLLHGVTHGDLHAGNILFIKDPNDTKYPHKIGIIDFGIIYEVGVEYKELLFDIFTQIFEKTSLESAEKLLNSGILEPPGILQKLPRQDYNNIVASLSEIIDETIHASKKANQAQIYKFLKNLNNYLSQRQLSNLGIRISDDFIKAQLVLAMSHGVTLTLCKDNYISLMDKVINELFTPLKF